MISLPGTLVISQKQGKYGTFNKAKLVTSIGDFTIKDKRVEQYEEGKYEGTFIILEIKPYSYLYQNRAVYEIQARLNDMVLNDNAVLTDEEKSLTAIPEHDPASDEELSTGFNEGHHKATLQNTVISKQSDNLLSFDNQTKQIDSAVTSSASDRNDEALFGVFWPLGDEVRLDSTEDRLKLREQSSRLKALNYQFDYKTQIWTKQTCSHLQKRKTPLPDQF